MEIDKMYEYKEKGQLTTMVGDILGEKYIRSLVLIIAAIFIPILVSNEIFGNMTLRSLELLGSGTIVLSTILIYTSLKLNPNTEAAEHLWGDIFICCYGLGGLSLVLTVSIYLPALISFTVLWSILIGALLAGGIWSNSR
jgi:hypothetical protein